MKTCSKCGETKALERFQARKTAKDGYCSSCKDCYNKYRAEWEARNPNKKQEYARKAFQKWYHENGGKEVRRKYGSDNREILNEYQRGWRAENLEKVNGWAREATRRKRAIKWGADADRGITVDALRQRDGEFCCYCSHPLDFKSIKHTQNKAHIEHITPIKRGGTHTWGNVALACAACNYVKGSREFLWDFFPGMRQWDSSLEGVL